MHKKFLWPVVFSALILVAYATRSAEAKTCDLNQSKFKLSDVATTLNAPDYPTGIQKELAKRKGLISEALVCAIEEEAALKIMVDNVSSDSAADEIRSKILGALGNAESYYQLKLSNVPNLGLEGSRSFAKDIMVWRQGNYVPTAKTASNFILWSQNQNLIRTAQSRIDQIGRTVAVLKLIDNKTIQAQWNVAYQSFQNSLQSHEKVAYNLKSAIFSEETLGYIKLTLQSLSETYAQLVPLVKDINKLTSGIQKSEGL